MFRKLKTEDFAGKKIVMVSQKCVNVAIFHFDDGTTFEVWAEFSGQFPAVGTFEEDNSKRRAKYLSEGHVEE